VRNLIHFYKNGKRKMSDKENKDKKPKNEPKKKFGRRYLTKLDKEFLRNNYHRMTDPELAKHLDCHVRTIENNRAKMGLTKSHNSFQEGEAEVPDHPKWSDEQSQEKKELINYHTKNFMVSARAERIRQQLPSSSDYNFFVEEWVSFQMQLEDLKHSEENIVEQIIFYKIRMYSNQKQVSNQQKVIDSALEKCEKPYERLNHEDDAYVTIVQAENKIMDLNKEFRELSEKSERLYQSLNTTRQQREKSGAVGADTFFKLIKKFENKKTRMKEGRMAGLINQSTNKKQDQMREVIEFTDGEFDSQLIDAETMEYKEDEE
jgi:predicted RNase H-like nuclease (RuvC/YqgF family)